MRIIKLVPIKHGNQYVCGVCVCVCGAVFFVCIERLKHYYLFNTVSQTHFSVISCSEHFLLISLSDGLFVFVVCVCVSCLCLITHEG